MQQDIWQYYIQYGCYVMATKQTPCSGWKPCFATRVAYSKLFFVLPWKTRSCCGELSCEVHHDNNGLGNENDFQVFIFALDQFSLSWKCRVACQCAKYDSRHIYSYTIGFLVAAWLIMCCTFKIAFKLTQFCSSNDKSSSSIRRFVYHLTNVFVKMVCSRKVNIYFIFELMSYY
jgi:hypothetical protein